MIITIINLETKGMLCWDKKYKYNYNITRYWYYCLRERYNFHANFPQESSVTASERLNTNSVYWTKSFIFRNGKRQVCIYYICG